MLKIGVGEGSVFTRVALMAAVCALLIPGVAIGQQQASISGKVVDPDDLALPGATVTVSVENTGYSRSTVTQANGSYLLNNLVPNTYVITSTMSGFQDVARTIRLSAGLEATLDLKMGQVGLTEEVTVEGLAPLVETTSNKIGGSLTGQEIEDVPSNFRQFTTLTQLIPGITPNPAQSTFEGGQVTANGSPAQSNVYLIDGMYNNDDRLGGSQGTQVRVVLDNIAEYQVLSNSYSAEFGGGAGAVINMVSRGGNNQFGGRVYSYFRHDKLNARNAFLDDAAPKPEEQTLQFGIGVGGPIVKNKAHFYFTYERDHEDIAGLKPFPAEAAPLAVTFVGNFEVRAYNAFARLDWQLNDSNFLSFRGVREKAPTKGEGFNTNSDTLDAQGWEGDLDELGNITLTSTLSDRASNVIRFGMIHEQLNSGAQTYFNDDVSYRGFDGREPLGIGQSNEHASYTTGKGGGGGATTIFTYIVGDTFSYFVPDMAGEHTFKFGGQFSLNRADPRAQLDSGTFSFDSDLPYNPSNLATYPSQFEAQVGPPGDNFPVFSYDRRTSAFVEDKWRTNDRLTLNLGVRYDDQRITPGGRHNIAPRGGFAYDLTGDGDTVVRGGIGRFFLFIPISVPVNEQRAAVITKFPDVEVDADEDAAGCNCVLVPDMINDGQGNPGIAVLSPAGQADIERRRAAILGGSIFGRNPIVLDESRKMAYQWAYSFGFSRALGSTASISADFVGNISRDQTGEIDINEPVNGVRPGVEVFDPNGVFVPAVARGTNFGRVKAVQSRDEFDADYKSLQVALVKRFANRWSGRLSYTLQKGTYVGSGNPDTRRVWLDNEITADKGIFEFNRTHVLAATASVEVFRDFRISGVISAISGRPVNETTGVDGNGDGERGTRRGSDRPIAGIDDATLPIASPLDSAGRAIINGVDGPGSVLLNMSARYSIALGSDNGRGLDLFFDVFNALDKTNFSRPTGNRRSSNFLKLNSAGFPRQMQVGARIRF